MGRPGAIEGYRASTVLRLDFRDGALTDTSTTGTTVAVAQGTAYRADGPYEDAFYFAGDGYVQANSNAATAVSGAFTLSLWLRHDPGTGGTAKSVIARRAVTGGQDNAWAIEASAQTVTAYVYNSAGTADSVSNTRALWAGFTQTAQPLAAYSARWIHVRFVFVPSTALYLYIDGQLAGYKTTSLANVANASLPHIQVGGEDSILSADSYFTGRIAHVEFRNAADTDAASTAPNVVTNRLSSRRVLAAEVDLTEYLQDDTWTDDTAGGYYIALSSLTLGAYVVSPLDIRSVVETTTATGATTSYTEAGSVGALDAGTDNWFLDLANRRLYVSENPASLASDDLLGVTIRARWGTMGMVRGCHYYPPTILSASAGRRAANWFNAPPDMGGGTRLALAASHPDLPTGIFSEQATGVAWSSAAVRVLLIADGLAWCNVLTLSRGHVASQPDDDRDEIAVDVQGPLARLYRRPVLAVGNADRDTYANLIDAHVNRAFPLILGDTHIDVAPICTRQYGTLNRTGDFKITTHQIAALHAVRYTGTTLSGATVNAVNLDAATFTAIMAEPNPNMSNVRCDVSGFGDATTSSGTSVPHGTAADTYRTPKTILQQLLILAGGLTSADFGSTWATTDTLVQRWLRHNASAHSPGSLVEVLGKILTGTVTIFYQAAAGGTWEWRAITSGTSVTWTIYDSDLITEQWRSERSNLGKKARALAHTYAYDNNNNIVVGEARVLPLAPRMPYVTETWSPRDENTGHYDVDALDSWLEGVRGFVEQPSTLVDVTVPHRFATAEIGDVVTYSSTRKPTGLGTRFRVWAVTPTERGIGLTLTPESPWSTWIDSGEAAITATREAQTTVPAMRFGDSTGIACTTTGAWTRVGTHRQLVQAAWKAYKATAAHILLVRAQRTGGAADTDFALRLVEVTRAGAHVATIASITGVSTSAGFVSTTTFSNVPSTDALVELQYYAQAGVSGTVWGATWELSESPAEIDDALQPSLVLGVGYGPGATCSTASAWTAVPNFPGFPRPHSGQIPGPSVIQRIAASVDASGATGMQLRIRSLRGNFNPPGTLVEWTSLTTASNSHVGTWVSPGFLVSGIARLEYYLTAGTGYVYAVAWHSVGNAS